MTAYGSHNSKRLKDAGADQVLVPYAYAAAEAMDTLILQDRFSIQPYEQGNGIGGHTNNIDLQSGGQNVHP